MNSISDVWQSVLSRLQEQLSETTIRTWFDEVDVVTMEDSAFVLHCSNSFKKSTIETRFMKHIKAALKDIFSSDLEVKILNDEQLAAYHGVAPDQPGSLLDSDAFTFETYVVGPQNKLAYAAARAVADKPAENFNPLFIYGDSGLGKTHLLYAIAHQVKRKREDLRIVYIKGDDFTNELIASIREGSNAEFREKYRQAGILLVDDIQFIAGKESTQEEFFHTFNSLYSANKQIIISSDKPPKDMEILDERFRSRFEWGLIVDITLPDYETRMAILHKKEDMDGYNVSEDVIKYIANNIKSNIRELEGAFNKVVAYAKLEKKEVTLELAEQALKDIVAPNENKQITADYIISMVAEHFNVSTADLCGNKRSSKIVMPRQVAMYLCREILAIPLKNVGQYLGNRDHTTVMHGVEKIEKELQNNEQLQNTIDTLKKKINPQT